MGCNLTIKGIDGKYEEYFISNKGQLIHIPMKEEVEKPNPVEVMIASQLSQFEVKEEDLKYKVELSSILEIKGVDDKDGRKAVSEARKHLMRTRTSITNTGKDLRDNFNKVSKAIIAREKDLIAIILPEEERLAQMESDIAEEEEENRKQKEYEEQEKIIARTKILEGYGATFNGVQYELSDNTITIAEVRLWTDSEFNRAIVFFKEYFDAEELRKAEEESKRISEIKRRAHCADIFLQSINARQIKFPYDIFNTDEELEEYIKNVESSIKKQEQDAKDAEDKRIAAEELKEAQDKLAKVKEEQAAQQAEIDRKKKELDDQLAEIQKQKMADAKAARQNQYVARRAVLLNTKTLLSQVVINDIDDSMYGLSEEGWNELVLELIAEHKIWDDKRIQQEKEDDAAEEKRRIEMQPDVEVLKQIAVDIKGTIVKHHMKTAKGLAVLNNINELKTKTVNYIEEQIKNL